MTAAFDEICRQFTLIRHNYLYVIDDAGHFAGVVSLHDIKSFLTNPDIAGIVIAGDIMRETFPSVTPDDVLTTVFERFAHHDGERLPVLGPDRMLVGSVAKADALLAFAEQPEMRSS